jgi:cysteine desulfurase / selenocysteine lyase
MTLVNPADFPAASQRIYLNAASVALMLEAAVSAVTDWQQDLALNGTLHFDEVAEEKVFDDLRASFAGLIGARATDVGVASSATEMIASLAWALMPAAGRTVVTTDIVFPSAAYPWARVARHTGATIRFVPAENGVIDEERLIEAINEHTAAVSISHVEYSNGQRYDLAGLAEAAHRVGAFLLVDASQSLGALPLNVSETPVDAIVTTSYKWLCGPFGVGLLYLAPEWQARLDPGIVGWRTHAEIYDLRAERCVPHNDARRFEFSTMAYGCAIGLTRSIDYLRQIGIDRIAAHDLALGERLLAGLRDLGADIVSPEGDRARSAIIGARLPGLEPRRVVRHLGEAGIVVSPRRDLVRFSPHLYNTEGDIDQALDALRGLVQG